MRRSTFLLPLFLLASPLAAQGTDCISDEYLAEAMAHLESHYRSFPDALFTAQLYLKEGLGQTDVTPDGKWGPKTFAAMCAALNAYTDVGGSDGDWGIRRASHTPQFTDWLLTTARKKLAGEEN